MIKNVFRAATFIVASHVRKIRSFTETLIKHTSQAIKLSTFSPPNVFEYKVFVIQHNVELCYVLIPNRAVRQTGALVTPSS